MWQKSYEIWVLILKACTEKNLCMIQLLIVE
jgi:hypothetical protein